MLSRTKWGQNNSNTWFIQSDAGCFDGGIVSIGCVIKDSKDNILTASCQRFSNYADIATASNMGILWAIHLAVERKLDNIVFQSDALMVVDCINGVSFVEDLELLVNDCKLLLSNFKFFAVMYLSRACNVDAHQLVHVGKRLGSLSWEGSFPDIAEHVDCIALMASS